jgi:hypothetical protein
MHRTKDQMELIRGRSYRVSVRVRVRITASVRVRVRLRVRKCIEKKPSETNKRAI